MKKKFRSLIYLYVFFCVIIIGTILLLIKGNLDIKNKIIIVTFFMNFVLILINLLKYCEIGYSLEEVFWIFMLAFMCIAPVIQYGNHIFPWWNTEELNDNVIIKTNLVIMLFIVTVIFSKRLIRRKEYYNIINFKNEEKVLKLGFYLSVLISVFIIYKTGLHNLFSRSTNYIEDLNQISSLIIKNTLSIFPIATIAMNFIYKKKRGHFYNKFQFVIILILGLVINFPTSMARFKMAAIYLGLFLILKTNFKNKYVFKILIIFGLLFIFPLINIFRHNTFADLLTMQINMPNPVEDFLKGDFDSYSMLARTLLYTESNGLTFGRQLTGNILFFVPRSIWANKPIGSGAHIARYLNWKFTNVSCPFIGEGYINFGIIGVIIFAIVFINIIQRTTFRYEYILRNNTKRIALLEMTYPFSLGFTFFIMRGDLLSSLSYLIGFLIPFIFFIIVDKIISKKIIIKI